MRQDGSYVEDIPIFTTRATRDIKHNDLSKLFLIDPKNMPTSIYDVRPQKTVHIKGVVL